MAVEMAKLSLWLITLQRDRPFSFLDHALKCGDSLLGSSSVMQIENFSLRPGDRQVTFATANLSRYVEESSTKRRALEDLPSNDHSQIATKNRLHTEAEAATAKVKALADALIAFELHGLDGDAYEEQRTAEAEKVQLLMTRDADASFNSQSSTINQLSAYAREQLRGHRPFHWAVEFPEVFAHGGFDGFIGNPPFLGGSKITIVYNTEFRDFLVKHLAEAAKGKADLAVYFLMRGNSLLLPNGNLGMVVTTSIAEGDSRRVGLERIVEQEKQKSSIYRARATMAWPGAATVTVAQVWLHRGKWNGAHFLDGKSVDGITPSLTPIEEGQAEPYRLKQNQGVIWRGTEIKGPGFVLSHEKAQELFNKNPENRKVIFPYITGEDINASPLHTSGRWVINFHDWSMEQASQFKDCFEITRTLVKPFRDTITKQIHEPDFWKLWDKRLEKYAEVKDSDDVLVISRLTKHVAFGFAPGGAVYSDKVLIFSFARFQVFAVLQSSFHYHWAWKYSPRNLSLLVYSTLECVEKFPLPTGIIHCEKPRVVAHWESAVKDIAKPAKRQWWPEMKE